MAVATFYIFFGAIVGLLVLPFHGACGGDETDVQEVVIEALLRPPGDTSISIDLDSLWPSNIAVIPEIPLNEVDPNDPGSTVGALEMTIHLSHPDPASPLEAYELCVTRGYGSEARTMKIDTSSSVVCTIHDEWSWIATNGSPLVFTVTRVFEDSLTSIPAPVGTASVQLNITTKQPAIVSVDDYTATYNSISLYVAPGERTTGNYTSYVAFEADDPIPLVRTSCTRYDVTCAFNKTREIYTRYGDTLPGIGVCSALEWQKQGWVYDCSRVARLFGASLIRDGLTVPAALSRCTGVVLNNKKAVIYNDVSQVCRRGCFVGVIAEFLSDQVKDGDDLTPSVAGEWTSLYQMLTAGRLVPLSFALLDIGHLFVASRASFNSALHSCRSTRFLALVTRCYHGVMREFASQTVLKEEPRSFRSALSEFCSPFTEGVKHDGVTIEWKDIHAPCVETMGYISMIYYDGNQHAANKACDVLEQFGGNEIAWCKNGIREAYTEVTDQVSARANTACELEMSSAVCTMTDVVLDPVALETAARLAYPDIDVRVENVTCGPRMAWTDAYGTGSGFAVLPLNRREVSYIYMRTSSGFDGNRGYPGKNVNVTWSSSLIVDTDPRPQAPSIESLQPATTSPSSVPTTPVPDHSPTVPPTPPHHGTNESPGPHTTSSPLVYPPPHESVSPKPHDGSTAPSTSPPARDGGEEPPTNVVIIIALAISGMVIALVASAVRACWKNRRGARQQQPPRAPSLASLQYQPTDRDLELQELTLESEAPDQDIDSASSGGVSEEDTEQLLLELQSARELSEKMRRDSLIKQARSGK